MDAEVVKLKQGMKEVEKAAELLLLAKQRGVDLDRSRNTNREALTALRRMAKTSTSSIRAESANDMEGLDAGPSASGCLTCGGFDGMTPVWYVGPSTDCFMRVPFHEAHLRLAEEQEDLELQVKLARDEMKEHTLSLSDKGGLPERAGPGLVNAFVNLKDRR